MPDQYSIDALLGLELKPLQEATETFRNLRSIVEIPAAPTWWRKFEEDCKSPAGREIQALQKSVVQLLQALQDQPPRQETAAPQKKRAGRELRFIACVDEAIKRMMHERANDPRSLQHEVFRVVAILKQLGVEIVYDKGGKRCKTLERRIRNAWKTFCPQGQNS